LHFFHSPLDHLAQESKLQHIPERHWPTTLSEGFKTGIESFRGLNVILFQKRGQNNKKKFGLISHQSLRSTLPTTRLCLIQISSQRKTSRAPYSAFPNPRPSEERRIRPRTSRFPSNQFSDQSVVGVAGGMAQTPNPSRRSWVGPAPMPFLTPRPERRHLEMRWADGVSQSAARRSGVGAIARDGCERDQEVNVQVMLRCR
jgi:hypothetical protein